MGRVADEVIWIIHIEGTVYKMASFHKLLLYTLPQDLSNVLLQCTLIARLQELKATKREGPIGGQIVLWGTIFMSVTVLIPLEEVITCG